MISMIAAIGKNNELGKNNDLIWNLPNDLKFFKEQTLGATVVMGRNTFNSLPRMLPNRKHVILTDRMDFNKDTSDCIIFSDLDKLIEFCKTQDVFIIGGASIYSIFVDIADKIILTEIEAEEKEADVYFPNFNKEKYKKIILSQNSDNNINYTHVVYEKNV